MIHYRERAEYIRHGTNWGNIENNLNTLSKLDNIYLMINPVASVFTYVTYNEFIIISKISSQKNDIVILSNQNYFSSTNIKEFQRNWPGDPSNH